MQRVKKISLVAVCFVFATLQVFAQGGGEVPCSGDPDDPAYTTDCPLPLDNWVVVLVIAGLIFATLYLYRKQKREAMLS